ncbi:substrate-binding domain-containing protein [Nitrospira moscoviensis]|uniref:Putative Phosphate-binding protein PstS n=1 Tax=Nitrospira moscoviensis TaxID=42253 RepID=A0A0K2G9J6_NITMO|nr:substrate-binding domain-containing protein [Nitrospira moscoviensis]ALA57529.1 putative Phosphate-binding protein PstS [Nitrospira moscoviensis]
MSARTLLACVMIGLCAAAWPTVGRTEVSGSLAIAGNGPELPTMEALARAFEKAHPRAYVDVLWDDNSKPLELVKSGQAQIAVTGAEDSGLAATQIGWDGIGILVHLSNFTKEVTKQQIADLYSGKVKEWSELGGPETKVLLIDRPRNQNIRDAFEAQLGIAGKIPETAKVIGKDDKVVKAVVGTLPPQSAVAYISLSTGLAVVSSGVAVRLLPVDKVEPEVPTVKDGRYSLRRPLLLLSKKEPNPVAEAFARFALSPPGQAIIADTYIPMTNK